MGEIGASLRCPVLNQLPRRQLLRPREKECTREQAQDGSGGWVQQAHSSWLFFRRC